MIGLALKMARETWPGTVLIGLGLAIVVALFTYVIPEAQEELTKVWMQMPLVRKLLPALLGMNIESEITSHMFHGITWVHPLVLALTCAHVLMCCTRFPVAEIDRATIDILLSWPVSRLRVLMVETAGWLLTGLFFLGMMAAGYAMMRFRISVAQRPDWIAISLVLINFYALYIAVGGLTYLCSAISNRRTIAIGVVFAIVLASFLLSFLAQFWEPAGAVSFLSILQYYQPARILKESTLTASDLVTLTGVGAASWVLAATILSRRSICTV